MALYLFAGLTFVVFFKLYLMSCELVLDRLLSLSHSLVLGSTTLPTRAQRSSRRLARLLLILAKWYRKPQVGFWRVQPLVIPRSVRMKKAFITSFQMDPTSMFDFEMHPTVTAVLRLRAQDIAVAHAAVTEAWHACNETQGPDFYPKWHTFHRLRHELERRQITFDTAHQAAASFRCPLLPTWQDYAALSDAPDRGGY